MGGPLRVGGDSAVRMPQPEPWQLIRVRRLLRPEHLLRGPHPRLRRHGQPEQRQQRAGGVQVWRGASSNQRQAHAPRLYSGQAE
jgi:hypothetical protein